MCSTNTTPPTTCVTGPIDAPTHSHVVPQANKAPRGPTASARDRTRREPASGHFARAPRGPTPRSNLILSTQQKARTSKAYLQDCHDRPADFVSPIPPSPAGGYLNGRTTGVISNLNRRSSVGTPAFTNRIRCQLIRSERIWYYIGILRMEGKKASWSTSNLHKGR